VIRLRLRLMALVLPLLVSVAALGLWLATGRDAYTKFTVVERVAVDQKDAGDDFFSQAGLVDEGEPAYEIVRRDEFRFGLLPTPQGVFDRHAVSMATIVGPAWALGILVFILLGRGAGQRNGGVE
jgi:hypothetical protein